MSQEDRRSKTLTAPAPRATVDLEAGVQIGDYEILELHAEGGLGAVYQARDTTSGEVVAVKLPHLQFVRDEKLLARFDQEIAAVSRLSHRNIVQILDAGDWRGWPYFVMEWIDGVTLREHLEAHGPLTVAEATYVLGEVTDALSAAHDAGIVHRDLKASNVMWYRLQDRMAVKVVDFGLAKFLREDDAGQIALTATGEVMGTPQAMAPEQLDGGPVDRRADIYSLGVLLFHLITGRYPFDGDSFAEVRQKHLHDPRPRAGALVPVPESVDAIIGRCMSCDPRERFQSVSELRAALAAIKTSTAAVEGLPAETTLGVLVSVYPAEGCDPDDETTADALDDAVEAVVSALRIGGLEIAVETGAGCLALASVGAPHNKERLETIRTAQRVVNECSADARGLLARVTAVVHCQSAKPSETGLPPLQRIDSWPTPDAQYAFAVTRDAMEGLEAHAAELGLVRSSDGWFVVAPASTS